MVFHFIKRLPIALLVIALNGCASFHPTQDAKDALVQVGTQERETVPVAQYAAGLAPYAIMAAKAYEHVDGHGNVDVSPTLFGEKTFGEKTKAAQTMLDARWSYVTGHYGQLCLNDAPSCGIVTGLEYQIWKTKPQAGVCREFAIAFRGTDANSIGDWLSNLHWVVRLLPLNDQYEQIQKNIQRVINQKIKTDDCYRASTQIVSVGHSLGGGLAQQAAYMTRDIRRVYVFDPSFVTGSSDIHSDYENTRKGLRIERAYEHGEILAYPRFVFRQIVPFTNCDPQIRTIRFNLEKGDFISQHRINDLAANLVRATPAKYRAAGYAPLPEPPASIAAECRAQEDQQLVRR